MPAFKYPRTSQPQGAVEVDWSNPLTRGLKALLVPNITGTSLYNVVPGGVQPTTTGTISRSVGPSGVGQKYGDASGTASQTYKFPAGYVQTAGSVFWKGRRHASGPAIFRDSQINSSGTLVWDNGSNAWNARVNGTTLIGVGSFPVDTDTDFLLTGDTGGSVFYVKGASLGSVGAAWNWNSSERFSLHLNTNNAQGVSATDYLVALYDRKLSALEAKSLSANSWQLFKPQSPSLWIPGMVSGGGAATVIPIGQQATGSVGTLVATGAAKGLPAGVSASSAVGAPVAVGGSSIPATVTPAGVSATVAVGAATATGQAKAYPSSVIALVSVGSPVALAGGAAVATPAGVQAVGAVGNLIATGQAWRVASGVSATGAVGTPVVLAGGSAIATPTGLQAVGSTGTPVATGACRTYPLGLAWYWSVGTPIAVPGVSGVAVAYPSGVQVGGYVGVPTAKGSSVAFAQGVYATGQVGFPVAGLLSIIPPGHVKFVPDAASYAFIPGTDAYSFEVHT